MNTRLLIIGGICALIMVLLGRNPVQVAREEAAAKMAGKDPLIAAIEEHNAKTPSGFRGLSSIGTFKTMEGTGNSTFGMGNNYMRPPSYPAYMHGAQSSQNAGGNRAFAPDRVVDNNGQPIYGQDGETVAPQPAQGYYPPPPLPTGR